MNKNSEVTESMSESEVLEKSEKKEPVRRTSSNRPEDMTIGQNLKRTRELRHISIDDIAKRLLISKSVVEDIENDDYSRIAAQTYAKGYLRAYAKILRIPEETILEGWDRLNPDVGSSHIHEDVKYNVEANTVLYKKIRWVGYAIFALIVFLVIAWVWGGHSANSASQALDNAMPSVEQQQLAAPSIALPSADQDKTKEQKVDTKPLSKAKVEAHSLKKNKNDFLDGGNYQVKDISDDKVDTNHFH